MKNINLHIAAGEAVAIVGSSGGGKTTMLKLLSGLLQPTEGEILVNGEPIRRVGLANYRAMLGVVMQDDQLFAGSIADNISFFADNPDFQRIEECAKAAAVHEDIMAMPMGFGTLIGDPCSQADRNSGCSSRGPCIASREFCFSMKRPVILTWNGKRPSTTRCGSSR
ncbi:MAG: ATP-binding cassette domain-containing protein [Xanthobacteraceae bacterium]